MKKVLFGLLLVVFSSFTQAAPLTPEISQNTYVVAYGQCPAIRTLENGCPPEWLLNPPIVQVATTDELCAIISNRPGCNVRGLYYGGQLFISSSLDFTSPMGLSVLLHEYIHHFQWLRNGGEGALNCTEWLADEHEAYTVQVHFLEKLGALTDAYRMRYGMASLQCPYDLMQKVEVSTEKVGFNEKLFLCSELSYDLTTIANAVQLNVPMEELIAVANAARQELRPDRLEKILLLIPEAYAYKGLIWDWVTKKYEECKE